MSPRSLGVLLFPPLPAYDACLLSAHSSSCGQPRPRRWRNTQTNGLFVFTITSKFPSFFTQSKILQRIWDLPGFLQRTSIFRDRRIFIVRCLSNIAGKQVCSSSWSQTSWRTWNICRPLIWYILKCKINWLAEEHGGKKSTKESETDNHRILESLKRILESLKKQTFRQVKKFLEEVALPLPLWFFATVYYTLWYVAITISIDICTFGATYNSNRHFKLTTAKYTMSKSMF